MVARSISRFAACRQRHRQWHGARQYSRSGMVDVGTERCGNEMTGSIDRAHLGSDHLLILPTCPPPSLTQLQFIYAVLYIYSTAAVHTAQYADKVVIRCSTTLQPTQPTLSASEDVRLRQTGEGTSIEQHTTGWLAQAGTAGGPGARGGLAALEMVPPARQLTTPVS